MADRERTGADEREREDAHESARDPPHEGVRDHSPSGEPGRTREDGRESTREDAPDCTPEDEDAPARNFDGWNDPLILWALASFHTGLLVALLVVGAYLAGPLGDLLGGLQTVVGLGLYLGLWASTWWTNRRWLDAVSDPGTDASTSIVVGTGGKWGGVNGVCFFLLALAVALAPEIELLVEALPFVLIALVIGSLLAFAVGAVVGALFAALDLALFAIAGRLSPATDG